VVTLSRNVRGHLDVVGEPHTRHLAKGRVGLLWSRGIHACAHPPLLRATPERRRRSLLELPHSPFANELIDRRQEILLLPWPPTPSETRRLETSLKPLNC